MTFTGERVIPGATPERIMADHLERYRHAVAFCPGRCVIDIACGVGYGSKMISEGGAAEVVGVDESDATVDFARRQYSGRSISYATGDICDYAPDRRFDVAVCFETIEHVEDYRRALANLRSLLVERGQLLISTPNRIVTSPGTTRMSDRPSNPFHVREFDIAEFNDALKVAGFEPTAIFGQRQCTQAEYLDFRNGLIADPKHWASPALTEVGCNVPRYVVVAATAAPVHQRIP